MATAIAAAGALKCRLQWPNDLVAEGRKVGGILTEMATDGRGAEGADRWGGGEPKPDRVSTRDRGSSDQPQAGAWRAIRRHRGGQADCRAPGDAAGTERLDRHRNLFGGRHSTQRPARSIGCRTAPKRLRSASARTGSCFVRWKEIPGRCLRRMQFWGSEWASRRGGEVRSVVNSLACSLTRGPERPSPPASLANSPARAPIPNQMGMRSSTHAYTVYIRG